MLGPTGAELDGVPVDLGGPRQRAVLALLLIGRGHTVSVDRMIDRLWQRQPPPSAIASLQAYISNLRKQLEPDRSRRAPARVLVSAAPGYALRLPDEAVDAWRFEAVLRRSRSLPPVQARAALEEALSWWHGPPLAEVADQEWAEAEVARLTELGLVARELVVRATLRAGRAAEAVPSAEAFTREHPLREEGWRLLALALWASGRQAEALSALRRARSHLIAELGLDPGQALAELEQAVLRQRMDALYAEVPHGLGSQDADQVDQAIVAVAAPDPATAVSIASAPRLFVGRDRELDGITEMAADARSKGGVVLVTGEPGAGKSELLGQIAHRLRADGWITAFGRCPEFDGAPPAWAWVEALRGLEEHLPPTDQDALRPLREPDAVAVPADAMTGRFLLHLAVQDWLRAAIAGGPLAIFIDDLHRADAETLALLECAVDLVGAPILVVAAYRPSDADDRLADTLARIAPRSPLRLALGGLPTPAVDAVMRAVCGTAVDRRAVAALAERTDGNPFYVWECARLMASEGELVAAGQVPQGVRDVLRRRLKRLPDNTVAILRLAAMFGREADVNVLIDAAELPEDDVLDGVEAAVIAGLLTEPSPGRLRFQHALVRETLYTDLPRLRRGRLHLRVARSLERLHPEDLSGLAHHYARSDSPATVAVAVEYAERAAEMATRRYAHDAAADLLGQAVDLLGRTPGSSAERDERMVGLLGGLLRAQIRAGSVADARQTRQRAIELAQAAGRDDLLIAALAAWTVPTPWKIRPYQGSADHALVAVLERLLADDGLDPATRCHLLDALMRELIDEDDPRNAWAAEQQLATARGTGDPLLVAAALTNTARLTPRELNVARRPAAAELRPLVYAHDLPAYQWACEHLDCMTAAVDGDPIALWRHAETGLSVARRYQLAESEAVNLGTLAMIAHIQGRFEEAEARYGEMCDLLERLGSPHAWPLSTTALLTIRLSQRRYAEVESLADALFKGLGRRRPGAVHGLAMARTGRFGEARNAGHGSRIVPDSAYSLNLSIRSELAALLGERDFGRELIELQLPMRDQFAGAVGLVNAWRPVAHGLGELYRMLGDEAEAVRQFRHAETVALRWGSRHCAEAARAAADGDGP